MTIVLMFILLIQSYKPYQIVMLQIGIGIKTTFRWFGYREISKNVGKTTRFSQNHKEKNQACRG